MVLIRRGTLLAVLLLLSSNFFVADVKGDDDVSLSSHRQLKSRSKNSKDRPTGRPTTENPTATPLPPFVTTSYRIVGDARGTRIDAFTTVGFGTPNPQSVPSFIGSKLINTVDMFLPENVVLDEDDNFVETKGDPVGIYTRTSQIDAGTLPNIERQSSSYSMCFSIPFYGGCILLHTGGEFQFRPRDETNRVPNVTFVSAGANTGVQFFGVEYVVFQQLLSNPLDGTDPNNQIEVWQLDVTQIIPTNACDIFERNVKLGQEVPGFIPKEGELRDDEVVRPRTRYTFFTEESCGTVL